VAPEKVQEHVRAQGTIRPESDAKAMVPLVRHKERSRQTFPIYLKTNLTNDSPRKDIKMSVLYEEDEDTSLCFSISKWGEISSRLRRKDAKDCGLGTGITRII
jgi:hypothetical protein